MTNKPRRSFTDEFKQVSVALLAGMGLLVDECLNEDLTKLARRRATTGSGFTQRHRLLQT